MTGKKHPPRIERRYFMTQCLKSAANLVQSAVSSMRDDNLGTEQMDAQITGDMAPELLAMEAGRLGLDPDKDRARIIQAIEAAMAAPGGDGNNSKQMNKGFT